MGKSVIIHTLKRSTVISTVLLIRPLRGLRCVNRETVRTCCCKIVKLTYLFAL